MRSAAESALDRKARTYSSARTKRGRVPLKRSPLLRSLCAYRRDQVSNSLDHGGCVLKFLEKGASLGKDKRKKWKREKKGSCGEMKKTEEDERERRTGGKGHFFSLWPSSASKK